MNEGHDERLARSRMIDDARHPRLLAYALRRARSREDAYDAVAERFLAAWRRLDDAPALDRRVPLLFGISRRALANHYRSSD